MRRFAEVQLFEFDSIAGEMFSLMQTSWMTNVAVSHYDDIVILATRAAGLTTALDQTLRQGKGHLPITALCGLTTIYQHDLNQINPNGAETSGSQRMSGNIFHLVRLAIQIFSTQVLFPLSGAWTAKPRLLRDLKAALVAYSLNENQPSTENSQHFHDHSTLLLWCATMGTIMAEGTEDRLWLIRRLKPYMARMELEAGSWMEFKCIVAKYLWWGYLFDSHARDIWDEVWGKRRQF
jgi:hypothetical protein